jgi:hypothetical protein
MQLLILQIEFNKRFRFEISNLMYEIKFAKPQIAQLPKVLFTSSNS